ncbi:MAG: hypothetical protein WA110_06890 [Anaerolineaceae bacterium]
MDKLRIKTNQQILHTFTLPYTGTVMVRTGQDVAAGDCIAEIKMPEHYQVFDVVNSFKINPKHLDRYIERLVGEPVKAGDVIAQKPGLFSRIFRASQDGMIVSIRDGKITLALGEKKERVLATFPGLVVELVPERGAVVATHGTLLQGVWGNGLNGFGELFQILPLGEDLTPDQINGLPEGLIVVAGACAKPGQLNRLLGRKPAGLVFGSVDPELLPTLEKLPIPVMCLVGFGDFPVDSYSSALLEKMAGKTVYLNASMPDAIAGVKPEVIMPGEVDTSYGLFTAEDQLSVGTKVRLLGKPYTGSVGIVIELPAEAEMFSSGLVMRSVVVKRQDEQIIRIPRENLEVIVE